MFKDEKIKKNRMNKLKFIPVIFLSCTLVTSCEDMWHHCMTEMVIRLLKRGTLLHLPRYR